MGDSYPPDAIATEDALVALGRLTYLHQTNHSRRRTILPRPDALQSKILDALGLVFPRKPKVTVLAI
jgi:hypothetical protein